MSAANIHSVILIAAVILISALFFFHTKLSYSSPFIIWDLNASFSLPFNSFARDLSIESNKNSQLFTPPNESTLVRLYLDVVRDTVCGLTLGTQELPVIGAHPPIKHPFNISLRVTDEECDLQRLINVEWAIRFVRYQVIASNMVFEKVTLQFSLVLFSRHLILLIVIDRWSIHFKDYQR